MRLIISILATLLFINCQCPPPDTTIEGFERAFERVNEVFIGKVLSRDSVESTYVLEIMEVFKGDLQVNKKIIGRNSTSCLPYIDESGYWLFFGNFADEFRAEDCGHTFFIGDREFFHHHRHQNLLLRS